MAIRADGLDDSPPYLIPWLLQSTWNAKAAVSPVPACRSNPSTQTETLLHLTCFHMMTRTIREMITITNSTKTAAATVSSDLKAVEEKDRECFPPEPQGTRHTQTSTSLPLPFPWHEHWAGAAPEAGD